MQPISTELEPYLQNQVEAGSSGLDIIHGHLKTLMLEAEEQFYLSQQREEESGEAMDSMERRYWEGVLDSLGDIYALTYQLSFAIAAKEAANE
jgi:hypothetical protein